MIAFGPFAFDDSRGLLLKDGAPLVLGQRAVAVLAALLRANGETVGKDALMAAAWPDSIVEEANLTVQIAALRKAMGTATDGADWILTVPRVGYRLPQPKSSDLQRVGGLPAIAVMPFANLSSDPDQDYFADGMTEDLITALSRFRTFSVISRASSFAMRGRTVDAREAGQLLGARYLLDGSVRRAGNSLRVTAQLADAERGAQLWADRFDGSPEDIFAMQDRITEAVIGHIQPEIRQAEIERAHRKRPENLDAYDLFLRALPMVQSANPADYDTALGFLRRAVELDPDYALATAFLAWVLEKRLTLNLASAGPGDRDEAVALARRAIAIGGDDPTVLVLGAWILIVFHVDWDAGLAAARRAYAANPNDLMILNMAGTCELLGGDLLASRALHSRAVALAPNSPDRYLDLTGVADTYLHDGDYEQALEWAQRSLQTFNDWPITFWNLTASSAHLGRMEQARQYLDRLLELAPGLTLSHFEALQMRDRVRWAHLTDGLRKAGLA